MTENDYMIKSSQLEQAVYDCQYMIRIHNREIEELQAMSKKVASICQSLENVSSAAENKIKNKLNLFMSFENVISSIFLLSHKNVYRGVEYQKSFDGIQEVENCIYRKIDEINDEISRLYGQINYLNSEISACEIAMANLDTKNEV